MTASPYCLRCETRIDPDEAVFVVVEGTGRPSDRRREASWVCNAATCLEWLAAAAEEEGCSLLQPCGIFDPRPRPDGRPTWLVWISKEKALAEGRASSLFEAIYRPYIPTAR